VKKYQLWSPFEVDRLRQSNFVERETFPLACMYSIGHKKSNIAKKRINFLEIFHDGLKCCLCVLNYWITLTKGLSNWDKVKIKQQEHTGLLAKT
jgi:hypothetical protein